MTSYNNHVCNWFHTGDPSPIEIVNIVVNTFMADVKQTGHLVCVTKEELFRSMCEAVCVYYHAHLRNEDVRGPKRLFPKPYNWNDSLEAAWNDYVHSCIFSYTYWESFWTSCEIDALEENVHGLTSFLQTILPLYVTREIQLLLDNEIVFENVSGIVSWEEYDSHDDE